MEKIKEVGEKLKFSWPIQIIEGTLESTSQGFNEIRKQQESLSNGLSVVVVIDIFRATSTIASLFQIGVENVIATDMEPENAQKISTRANNSRKDSVYLPIGSDHKGQTNFILGNSPTQIIEAQELLRGKIPFICTSKGTKALIQAHRLEMNHIVIGAYSTLLSTVKYLNEIHSHNEMKKGHVYLVATEGRMSDTSDQATITEDYLYAECLTRLLQGESNEIIDSYVERTKKVRGARRFRKPEMQSSFPESDIAQSLNYQANLAFVPVVSDECSNMVKIKKVLVN